MNTLPLQLWLKVFMNGEGRIWLHRAMRQVAFNLSELIGRTVTVDTLRAEIVPLRALAPTTADPEAETLAIFLSMADDLPGRAILMLNPSEAMRLTDWLFEAPEGTTTQLGQLEYSALAETGNLTLASFLNTLAELTQNPLRFSAPVISVDMLATVLQQVIISVGEITDELLVIKTDFKEKQETIWLRFWVVPDPAILKALDRSQTALVLET